MGARTFTAERASITGMSVTPSPAGFAAKSSALPLVYPAANGGHLNLHNWRRNEWYPALDDAGLPRAVPYAMRHTFASFSIAAGVSLFYLARLMGSSVDMIDKTYVHLLPDSEAYLRGLLDAFDDDAAESAADAV